MKLRQDAWLKENDELLAEAVIRHVKEGSTQLNAFEEAGDLLNRTAAACGFRWNAVVRKVYEEQLSLAKKERKERMRTLGAISKRKVQPLFLASGSHEEQRQPIPLSALSLDIVIAYLVRLQHQNGAEQEAIKWKNIAQVAIENTKKLEAQIAKLEQENKDVKEDYEQFVQIMNRARKLVTLDGEEDRPAPVFKMERNGNLIVSTPAESNEMQL